MVYEGRTIRDTCPECGASDICPVDVCDWAFGETYEGIECQKCGYRVVARTMAAAVSDWNGPCPHCGVEGSEPMETDGGIACCDDCACVCSGCGAVVLQDDAEELDGERYCVFIHTPLGWITQAPSERWLGYLEIAPRSDANGPEAPIMQIEGRTREQLLRRMLDEARCQMRLLGTMISWAENQEWARRGKR